MLIEFTYNLHQKIIPFLSLKMTCQALYGHMGRIIISKYTCSLFIPIET